MRYLKVTRSDADGWYICDQAIAEGELNAHLDGAELGDSVTFTLVEMTDGQYEDLPEFEGW